MATTPLTVEQQSALYDQLRAGSTNVPGIGYIPNDLIQGDSRGSWIGAPTNAAPNTWVGSMAYLNDVPKEQLFDVATGVIPDPTPNEQYTGAATPSGDPNKLASVMARQAQLNRPGIVSRPYPGGRPPRQQPFQQFGQGQPLPGVVNPFANPINPNARLDPAQYARSNFGMQLPNRAFMGPGSFQPNMRRMSRVGQSVMPGRNMPAFQPRLPSPYVQADASGISPQQRGQQGGLSPALMQYLASLAATYGGSVPPGIFGPGPQYQGSPTFGVPPATEAPPSINMTRQEDVFPTGT